MIRAGKTIFRKGDAGSVAYVIQSGTVEIVRPVAGHRRVIAKLAAGEIFGEMALIDGKPRMADAVALDDVTLLEISADQFNEKMRTADPFMRALLRMFSSVKPGVSSIQICESCRLSQAASSAR